LFRKASLLDDTNNGIDEVEVELSSSQRTKSIFDRLDENRNIANQFQHVRLEKRIPALHYHLNYTRNSDRKCNFIHLNISLFNKLFKKVKNMHQKFRIQKKFSIYSHHLVTLTAPRPGVGRGKANTETTLKFSKSLVIKTK
jgi:hypothetical protein